jgi:hypothetical protein
MSRVHAATADKQRPRRLLRYCRDLRANEGRRVAAAASLGWNPHRSMLVVPLCSSRSFDQHVGRFQLLPCPLLGLSYLLWVLLPPRPPRLASCVALSSACAAAIMSQAETLPAPELSAAEQALVADIVAAGAEVRTLKGEGKDIAAALAKLQDAKSAFKAATGSECVVECTDRPQQQPSASFATLAPRHDALSSHAEAVRRTRLPVRRHDTSDKHAECVCMPSCVFRRVRIAGTPLRAPKVPRARPPAAARWRRKRPPRRRAARLTRPHRRLCWPTSPCKCSRGGEVADRPHDISKPWSAVPPVHNDLCRVGAPCFVLLPCCCAGARGLAGVGGKAESILLLCMTLR